MKKEGLQKGLICGSSEGTRCYVYTMCLGAAASFLSLIALSDGLSPWDAAGCTNAQRPFRLKL